MNKKKLIDKYKNKNVYITGITGFKGGWLALMLHHLGANVHGIGLEPREDEAFFYQAGIDDIALVTIGDITEIATSTLLIPSILVANPDYIFHLAETSEKSGYDDPFNIFHTNIMGTVTLHEIIRGLRMPACLDDLKNGKGVLLDDINGTCKKVSVVNVASGSIDGELGENKKFDPYTVSKLASSLISNCYRDSLKSPHFISTVRTGEVIGGGDTEKGNISAEILHSIQYGNNSEVVIKNPHNVCLYQHVFDALSAYLIIAAKQTEGKSFQGDYEVVQDSREKINVFDFVKLLEKDIGFKLSEVDNTYKGDEHYSKLDDDLIRAIGWKPVFSTNEEVAKSVSNWYNSYIQGSDMQDITLAQIESAFNKL